MQVARSLIAIAYLLTAVHAVDHAKQKHGGGEGLMRREESVQHDKTNTGDVGEGLMRREGSVQHTNVEKDENGFKDKVNKVNIQGTISESVATPSMAKKKRLPAATPTFRNGNFEAITIKEPPGMKDFKETTYAMSAAQLGNPDLTPQSGWKREGGACADVKVHSNRAGETGRDPKELGTHSGVYVSLHRAEKGKACYLFQDVGGFVPDKKYLVTFRASYSADRANEHKKYQNKRSNYGGQCECPDGSVYDVGVPVPEDSTKTVPCTLRQTKRHKNVCEGGRPTGCSNLRRAQFIEKENRTAFKQRKDKTTMGVKCMQGGGAEISITPNGLGQFFNRDGTPQKAKSGKYGQEWKSLTHGRFEDVAAVIEWNTAYAKKLKLDLNKWKPNGLGVMRFNLWNPVDGTRVFYDDLKIEECYTDKNGKATVESCLSTPSSLDPIAQEGGGVRYDANGTRI